MSWLFSQALVGAFLEENSSDGELSAQLSGHHTQQVFLPSDKTTAFWRLSQYGMTCKPLTESRGRELLTWYLAGFPAKTSARQERVPALMESAPVCGGTWRESLARFDPATHSWKTAQCSLLGGLESFSETWPRWGLMRHGECLELTTLAPSIKGNAYGFLPTPIRSDGDGGGICRSKEGKEYNLRDWWANQGLGKSRQSRNPKFWEWVMGWPMWWTDLTPLEMDKYQSWLQQHGECLEGQ